MRSFLSSLFATAALLSAALVSSTVADEIAIHLPEDAPAGQPVGDLRELLQLAPSERVRLSEEHHDVFRIDGRDRLVVAPRARLDHESQPRYRITLRIVNDPDGRTQQDPLQSRFSELLTEQQKAGRPSDDDGADRGRTATLRVLVDDVAEPPLLLGGSFRVPADTTPRAGQRIGRAIVIDPDRQEQHHFELLDGGDYLRIDPRTGELYLREEIDPLSVATLRAVVRVTDRAGLSAQTSYPVRLNESPPPPLLPVLLAEAEDRPATEDITGIESDTTSTSASASTSAGPAKPRMPRDGTETARPAVAATPTRTHSESVAPVLSSPSAQSGGPAWLSEVRAVLSWFGLGGFDDHRTEWVIFAAVVMCVVVIVISGVRDAMLAGREPVEGHSKHQADSTGRQNETPRQAVQRDPQEIAEILERLDTVIGRSEHAAGGVETGCDADAAPEPAEPALVAGPGTDAKTGGVAKSPSAEIAPGGESPKAAEAAAVVTPPAVVSASEPAVEAAEESAVVIFPAPPLQRSGEAMTDEERQRIEQFREISRMINRADIGRRSRERMRDEWLSVGVTSLACVVTGTVCVFTRCFGTMSVPIGTVMFAVSAVLLMRPSLYLQYPHHGAAASQTGTQRGHRAR